jgi:DNA topoisomerase-2
MSKGVYNIVDNETIEITELPIGKWTDDYKKFLDTLLADNNIKDYTNNSSDNRVNFLIKLEADKMESLQWSDHINIDGIEKFLKLTTTKGLSTNNMHLYNNKSRICKYDDIYEIFDTFIKERLKLYKKRYDFQCKNYSNKIDILNSKRRFIEEVINEDIIIFKRKRKDVVDDLIDMQYLTCMDNKINKSGNYDYLLKISVENFTEEEINRLEKERDKIKKEYDILKAKSIKCIWIEELHKLSKYL